MRDADFQRLLFDYSRRCRERGVDPPYDFVAQEDGPRSFTAAADRDRLARHGLFNSGVWHLTDDGHRLAGKLENRDVAVFAARLQRRNDAAGAGVENQMPTGDHHPGDAAEDSGNPNGGLLATIGYERRSYEAYFNQLLGVGISRLCDVRRNPISRKWGFSKRLLSRGCEELGIRYEPFPELGIASRHRAGLRGRAAYDRLFARYEATTLPRCRDAVARIARWIDAGERVAITCYERDSPDCHRSRLAKAIVRAVSGPMLPRHL